MVIFFFNDTATTEIYTLSLHDALPISFFLQRGAARDRRLRPHRDLARPDAHAARAAQARGGREGDPRRRNQDRPRRRDSRDRKSTRLNSSHGYISHAVFCLTKKA